MISSFSINLSMKHAVTSGSQQGELLLGMSPLLPNKTHLAADSRRERVNLCNSPFWERLFSSVFRYGCSDALAARSASRSQRCGGVGWRCCG